MEKQLKEQSIAEEYLRGYIDFEASDSLLEKLRTMNRYTIEDVKGFYDGLTTHTFDHVGWEGVEFILKSDLTGIENLKL